MVTELERVHTIASMHERPGRPPMTLEDFARITASRLRGAFRVPRSSAVAGPPAIATIESGQHRHAGDWRSRWGAHCWLEYAGEVCQGYEDVDPDDPRFFCFSCFNAAVGGAWRPLEVPSSAERERIEELVMLRANPRTRAFLPAAAVERIRSFDPVAAAILGTPGDTVRELERQNLRLGDPLPGWGRG